MPKIKPRPVDTLTRLEDIALVTQYEEVLNDLAEWHEKGGDEPGAEHASREILTKVGRAPSPEDIREFTFEYENRFYNYPGAVRKT